MVWCTFFDTLQLPSSPLPSPCSLMGNIHVRRAGYAYRQLYNDFLARYKMLCKRTWPRWKGSAREGTREILKVTTGISPSCTPPSHHSDLPMQACRKRSSEYSMGRTKVFLQSPKTVFDLEDRRRDRMQYLATLIQKVYRGHVERQKVGRRRRRRRVWGHGVVVTMWECITVCVRECLTWCAPLRLQFLRLRAAQTTVSKCWRGLVCRRAYLQLREAAIVFQKYYRGHQVGEK